jgi:hypothetical protein
MTREKRKYTRLSPSTWAELRAYWESGDHGLAELSDRYGVSQRAIQSHLKKLGSVKGSKAAEMAAVVKKEIFKGELGSADTLVIRAKETREATYANAVIIESLAMGQLAMAQKDPTQAFKAATAMKMLSLAAATLERTQTIKWRALGLDKDNALPDELPTLTFRDLNKDELEALQKRDEADEDGELGISIVLASTESPFATADIDESDEIIEEGGEIEAVEIIEEGEQPEEPLEARPKSLNTLGGRLVKEARH